METAEIRDASHVGEAVRQEWYVVTEVGERCLMIL